MMKPLDRVPRLGTRETDIRVLQNEGHMSSILRRVLQLVLDWIKSRV